jgi:putative hemolysin
MQKFLFIGIVSTLILASCGANTSAPTPAKPVPTIPEVNYPTSQAETPATQFCVSRGGTVSVEKNDTGVEMAYCTTQAGEKVDAWKYMSDETSKTETGAVE